MNARKASRSKEFSELADEACGLLRRQQEMLKTPFKSFTSAQLAEYIGRQNRIRDLVLAMDGMDSE